MHLLAGSKQQSDTRVPLIKNNARNNVDIDLPRKKY